MSQLNLGAPTEDEARLASEIANRLYEKRKWLKHKLESYTSTCLKSFIRNEVIEVIMEFNRDVGERKG